MSPANDHPLLATFEHERCSAILRTPHGDAVERAMDAAIAGGFRIVEFTLNTPGALDHITAFAERGDLQRVDLDLGCTLADEPCEDILALDRTICIGRVGRRRRR